MQLIVENVLVVVVRTDAYDGRVGGSEYSRYNKLEYATGSSVTKTITTATPDTCPPFVRPFPQSCPKNKTVLKQKALLGLFSFSLMFLLRLGRGWGGGGCSICRATKASPLRSPQRSPSSSGECGCNPVGGCRRGGSLLAKEPSRGPHTHTRHLPTFVSVCSDHQHRCHQALVGRRKGQRSRRSQRQISFGCVCV